MTEVKTSEDVIMELKAEIEALKCAIAEQQEKAEAKRIMISTRSRAPWMKARRACWPR